LLVHPYDWRRSNILAAETLADRIDRAVIGFDGPVEITLIAHSMGGLVSRFYLESGDFSGRAGFGAVRQLITLGTPHLGSPLALMAALGKMRRLFLSAAQVKRLANHALFPSVYELFPACGEPFAWDFLPGTGLPPIDIYDSAIAARLGLFPAHLSAAQTWRSRLDPSRRPQGVRYFCFMGSRQATISAVTIDFRRVDSVTPVEADNGGDGTVPIWSAGLAGLQGRPVGGDHGTIYKNDDLRRTLGLLLGYQGLLAATVKGIEVAIRDQVVEPLEPMHVSLSISSGTSDLQGNLRLSRANVDASGALVDLTALAPTYPILYEGITADHLNVILTAPEYPGVYSLEFVGSDGQVLGRDQFFVQSPPPRAAPGG
jgi:pimeloyl-ACP methyl ester carboxylesterase